MRRPVLIAAFMIAALNGAAAQSATEMAKTMAGGWEVSNADRDRTCKITLRADPARTGFRLDLDDACAVAIPAMKDVDAWTVTSDTVRLIDVRGRAIFDFAEVEHGMYETERPGEGLFFLQSLAAARPEPKTAEQMSGDWTLMRAGNAICSMTLAGNAAEGREEGDLALRVRPGCDAVVVRAVAWRLDQGEIVLVAASGQNWRFAPDESQGSVWKRIPETAQQFTMVRK